MDLRLLIARAVDFYSLMMLVWVISSWIPQLQRNALVREIGRVCEPPLRLVRQVLPAAGGMDFSPMLVIIGLQMLSRAIIGGF